MQKILIVEAHKSCFSFQDRVLIFLFFLSRSIFPKAVGDNRWNISYFHRTFMAGKYDNSRLWRIVQNLPKQRDLLIGSHNFTVMNLFCHFLEAIFPTWVFSDNLNNVFHHLCRYHQWRSSKTKTLLVAGALEKCVKKLSSGKRLMNVCFKAPWAGRVFCFLL